ncbi:Up-regulated during septation-domain-containing protein [Clohesyomyces aquaticus]|uniref:Up-regulated during septation-domain-containing protein n=1 Tax=Clohesyomyces aquaticus TaxID=1231657 RepID=A0A1Y1ZFC2_9PLEO|nr:Up-regulated during septation-domain-containing protein [Clohesyomyces aquaticus]
MTSNGLRTQYPYGVADALSPRPLYDFPSPTSNYPSGVSPGFNGMASYQNTPRYGSNAFVPPPDVFEARKGSAPSPGPNTPREYKKRSSDVLNADPVAMHLLVETAIGDSQSFEILSVEEVEALKQERKVLDTRLGAVRIKLASETKIRDAALSLGRLTSKKGHRKGMGSRGSNASRTTIDRSEDEVNSANRKVDHLTREYFELESRMRAVESQLLMHTAGVLQFTHAGPAKRRDTELPNGEVQRPDSPASIYTYENNRSTRTKPEDTFDERSLYRSPENLDNLMSALQNGTHHHANSVEQVDRPSQALSSMEQRLEELNDRLRELIVQANPERNKGYSLPPRAPVVSDTSSLAQQLDFLDQGLRDIGVEQTNIRNNSRHSLNAVEGRLEGINNQLYAMLNRADTSGGEKFLPPPPISGGGSQEQLNYMEDSYYSLEQIQYTMSEELEQLRSKPTKSSQDEQYETTLMGLWSIIQAGEEEARQRRQQRRDLLAPEEVADDDLSADEDVPNPNEEFSLNSFSAKVQWLYSRASSLKEKQGILLRQIKQQRELNSRSDEQKEAEFARLHDLVDQARNEKATTERELERAIDQLHQFDEQRIGADAQALQDMQDRCANLEMQLKDAQDDARVEAATIQAELSESSAKIDEAKAALAAATAEKDAAEARAINATNTLKAKESELRDLESEVVRLTTEVTLAKAELDGAYGTRAQRAAEAAANPTFKKELEDLTAKNAALIAEIESLRKAQDAASQSEAQARESERNLKQELAAMAAEYEALTRDSIQNEKDRDVLEASIDKLRDDKEQLEMELSDEKVRWLGVRSPSVGNGGQVAGGMEATSIRMLREDFRKMMRDRTAEGLKALRHEQEERRKLEAQLRSLRRDVAPQKSNLSKTMTA